jgi:signal peptidase I
MTPTIQDGEILEVRRVAAPEIKIGDIVLFKDHSGFKVHRVIWKKGSQMVTKGDSSVTADSPINDQHIIGKVVARQCAKTGGILCLEGTAARLKYFAAAARAKLYRTIRSLV